MTTSAPFAQYRAADPDTLEQSSPDRAVPTYATGDTEVSDYSKRIIDQAFAHAEMWRGFHEAS